VSSPLRIGELSRRTDVAPELLRAWERRYGLLRPSRTDGGYRLYTEADVDRVHTMQAHLDAGVSAAEAAKLALEAPAPIAGQGRARVLLAAMREALDKFDGAAAHAVIDDALSELTLDTVLSEIVLSYLAELGARWERGEASIAQEHFASNLLRGRLLGLARGWDRGSGRRAVLACAPGELHDLPLLAFGLALRERGWRITYLGVDTPVETIIDAARSVRPRLVVVSSSMPGRLIDASAQLGRLASTTRLGVAGPGAADARISGAVALGDDPVTEAERISRER
jgi:DNA-binding transcriptional MerR regulator